MSIRIVKMFPGHSGAPRLGLTAVASQYGCAEALGRGCEGPHAPGQDVLGAHEGGECLVM